MGYVALLLGLTLLAALWEDMGLVLRGNEGYERLLITFWGIVFR
jgi:hypothetical protein